MQISKKMDQKEWSEKDLFFFLKKLNFTDRQIDIIKALVNQKTNKQIAEEFHISIETVKTHRKNIYSKANTHNSSSLIIYLYQNGLNKD